jgi:hypothetical protein
MVSLRSLGIFLILAGIVGTMSPALQQIGIGAVGLGIVLLGVYFMVRRRKRG